MQKLQELLKDAKRKVSHFAKNDGPVHQKLVQVEDDMEENVRQIDEKIDQTVLNLDERMERVGIVLEQAGREFDEHLEEVEKRVHRNRGKDGRRRISGISSPTRQWPGGYYLTRRTPGVAPPLRER